MDLILRESYPLNSGEKQEINNKLDKLISESKNNTEITQKLMSEAVSLATSVEARADGLKNQGLLGRLWGDLIGSNHKTSANNQKDLATAQYLSQQLLVKLSEQNAITLEMVEDLASKVHTLSARQASLAYEQDEMKDKIANIHALLERFFIKIRDRFDRIENQANLNSWTNYIVDHEILGDKTYCQLTFPARLMCLVNEFFNLTKGRWDKKELAILKGTMRLVGVDPKEKLKAIDLFISYQEEPQILNKLHENIISHDDFVTNTYDSEYLIGFTKLDYLRHQGKENFKELVRLIGDKPAQEMEIAAVTNELLWAGGSNPAEPQSAFSIVETLLHDLKNIQTITQEETALPKLPKGKSYPSRKHLEYKIMKPEELKVHADNDNALAQYFYGKHLEEIDEDTGLYEEMYLYYQVAAEQGLSDANYELGECYYFGNGVEEDEPHAFEYYQIATVSGEVIKIGQHAGQFTNEFMKKDDPIKQAKWTMLAAKMGRRRSMLELGKLYQDGTGIKKDIKKAFSWIQKSADAGLNDAYFKLSECYRLGKGVTKNNSLALVYCHFAQSWEGEDSNDYNHHYFETYWNDENLDKDKFFNICKEVAETGDRLGQYCLSVCYCNGWGVEEDREQELIWIQEAAANGLFVAQLCFNETIESIRSHYEGLVKEQRFANIVLSIDLINEPDEDKHKKFANRREIEEKNSDEYFTYIEYSQSVIELGIDMMKQNLSMAMKLISNVYCAGIDEFDSESEFYKWQEGSARLGNPDSILTLANLYTTQALDKGNQPVSPDRNNAIFWNRLSLLYSKNISHKDIFEEYSERAQAQLLELDYQ